MTHVAYNFMWHAVTTIREVKNAPPGYHDTIASTVCGVDVYFQNHERRGTLRYAEEKPLTCIRCITET